MDWLQKAVPPGDRIAAAERPARYVLRKAWELATAFTFVHVVVAVTIPGRVNTMAPTEELFVAVVGGMLCGLMFLWLARRAKSDSGNTIAPSLT